MKQKLAEPSTATIIVKAAPRVGKTHGELVCCAGIDEHGNWVRLYPVAFRTLDDEQKFTRWDRIQYEWRPKPGDSRAESRRIIHGSIEIIGNLKPAERSKLIAPLIKSGLSAEAEVGRSFAFLRPRNPKFYYEKKQDSEFDEERKKFSAWHKHETEGLFGFVGKRLVPYEPSPYRFKYKYLTADGERDGTCQDWEIEAAFLKWRRRYSEADALKKICSRFGEEYPQKGFVFAMGTHKAYKQQWLINGVVRLDHGAENEIQGKLDL